MYRIEAMLFLLALLPLIMALIFSFAVVPRRQQNLEMSMDPASRPAITDAREALTESLVAKGIERAVNDFESLRSYRLLIPALILTLLYWVGFSLGISLLIQGPASTILSRPFAGFNASWLYNPAVALAGTYVFNMGMLVRRAFMADFTKNVMWAAVNRIVLSCGYALVMHFIFFGASKGSQRTGMIVSFAIAFFPRVLLTVLRRYITESFGVQDDACKELNVQLIRGIDVWKAERLEEEGIESVQNMATADIFGLIPKLHYPVRTIINWMDQAIFIQRFALCFSDKKESALTRLRDLENAGFSSSAMEYASIGRKQDSATAAFITKMSEVAKIDRVVLQQALENLSQDASLRVLRRLWQTGSLTD